jgi:hypothetical protein
MKLNLITVLALFITVGTASAQTFNLGIKGGLNVYTISGTNEGSYDAKPSFYIGLLGHIHIADHFAIQPEAVFSSQGAKYGDNLNLNLNYVNMPLLFQYMFDNGFRFQGGPQLGILVGAKADGNEVKTNFKAADIGLTIGASYVHPPSGFGVDARYNHGLSNISDNDSSDAYNRGFQVGVFYLFKHKS